MYSLLFLFQLFLYLFIYFNFFCFSWWLFFIIRCGVSSLGIPMCLPTLQREKGYWRILQTIYTSRVAQLPYIGISIPQSPYYLFNIFPSACTYLRKHCLATSCWSQPSFPMLAALPNTTVKIWWRRFGCLCFRKSM